jgi:sulfatase maturation enzyme AslB (radical SAM superfamily)
MSSAERIRAGDGALADPGVAAPRLGAGARLGARGPLRADLPALDLVSTEAGPKRVTTLLSRGSPLSSPSTQRRVLAALELAGRTDRDDFAGALAACGWGALVPAEIEIFQINLGKLCNMTCRHCHVDAGPDRTEETMDRATAEACLRASTGRAPTPST